MSGPSADEVWRWVVRVLGVIGFVTILVIFAMGREVSAAWIFLIGGLLGLDGLAGVLKK